MEYTESVENLWENRMQVVPHFKRTRMARFFPEFEAVIRNVHRGVVYGPRRAARTPYFDYLRGYRDRWMAPLNRRSRRQIWERFKDGIDLYHSIKADGIRDPLVMRQYRNGLCIYMGTRRLVIAHVLGIPTVRCIVWEAP